MTASAPDASDRQVAIAYLDGFRVQRALRAGIAAVLADQDHLNKINVYPVPDGDTGTNLALTLHAILLVIGAAREAHAGRLLERVADAAIDGARGNSGAILAQFLHGVADACARASRLDATALAAACANGATYARAALSEPVEGTMLTVLDDFASALTTAVAGGEHDIATAFAASLTAARKSLANTPNLLDSLRRAGVVDAGAAGFVDLLDGMEELLREGYERELPEIEAEEGFTTTAGEEIDLDYRYCTECLLRGEAIDPRKLRERLTSLGNSLVIAGGQRRARVHIHTNDPERVFDVAREFGTVSGEKADDMQRQQELVHSQRRRVVVATDTGGDVPDEIAERLNIYQTSIRVHFGQRSYLDKVGITPEQLYQRLRCVDEEPPKTSQPPPGDFRRQFQFLASHYEQVVSVNLTARASGTYQAAASAANGLPPDTVHVVDSKNASLGQGLLVIDAAEAVAAGLHGPAVVDRVREMIPRTRTFGALGDLSCAVRGGRVPGWVKRVADSLHLVPVLGNRRDGQIKPVGVLLGRTDVVRKFARFVLRRVDPDKTYRLAVGHADCDEDGRRLLALLSEGIARRHETLYTRIGTALGVHTGPAGLVVALQEYQPLPADDV